MRKMWVFLAFVAMVASACEAVSGSQVAIDETEDEFAVMGSKASWELFNVIGTDVCPGDSGCMATLLPGLFPNGEGLDGVGGDVIFALVEEAQIQGDIDAFVNMTAADAQGDECIRVTRFVGDGLSDSELIPASDPRCFVGSSLTGSGLACWATRWMPDG